MAGLSLAATSPLETGGKDSAASSRRVSALESLSPIGGTSLLEELKGSSQDDDDAEGYSDTEDSRVEDEPNGDGPSSPTTPTDDRSRSSKDGGSTPDSETEDVDWEHLQKHEDEQSKGPEADNTALLLARLDQENAKLAANPRNTQTKTADDKAAPPSPSMAQLRQMVHGPTPPALRYSMLPPPPMTDLEFYMALVKNYQQTAARLPTLLSNKIRKGIPPPLRGVVWQSMAGARDASLEAEFERCLGESSPYEGIINQDLGRSFPGIDMFRDPDGDGQRMLGRVLKSYSIYDPEIGYCQGLSFLVGPLLMHMPDKQAFCVLVRLMESYDLRSCFQPDLAGLHVRIYQFRKLLQANLPTLSDHLDDLRVDPVYVSQWFLSFFAVTCPLPMLFRIYDVVFAEGAPETLMRVALSLMRKNQARILACTELEDVMQLLVSRGLWDCYHYNADEFVQDFVGLHTAVDRERLDQLEKEFLDSQGQGGAQLANSSNADASAAFSSDVATAASRFLGRLASSISSNNSTLHQSSTSTTTTSSSTITIPAAITPSTVAAAATTHQLGGTAAGPTASSTPFPAPGLSNSSSPTSNPQLNSSTSDHNQQQHRRVSPPSSASTSNAATPTPTSVAAATLTPGGLVASSRPLSMLRRSASKQSLASTLNSMEANSSSASSAASVLSSTSTDATSLSRDSSASDDRPINPSAPGGAGLKPQPAAIRNRSNADSKYLNNQIEDLLIALSDLQRQQVLLADQLQRERDEREEDGRIVRSLLDGLKQAEGPGAQVGQGVSLSPLVGAGEWPAAQDALPTRTDYSALVSGPLGGILGVAEERFGGHGGFSDRRSSISESKSQLRDQLARTKEQLNDELAKGQDNYRRVTDLEQEISTTKEQLRESHAHVRSMHQEKQRLEKQIHTMRVRASNESAATPSAETASVGGTDWFGRATSSIVGGGSSAGAATTSATGTTPASGGLRELKLGRARSTPSQTSLPPNKRASSVLNLRLGVGGIGGGGSAPAPSAPAAPAPPRESLVPPTATPPSNENETLLLELVQAKTAEAMATQEAEEYKQKLETLRKALGLGPGEFGSAVAAAAAHQRNPANTASNPAASAAMAMFGRFTASMAETAAGKTSAASAASPAAAAATAPAANTAPASAPSVASSAASAASGVGSFFGWGRR